MVQEAGGVVIPEYLFVHRQSGVVMRVVVPMADIERVTLEYSPKWRRVYTAPHVISVPGYVEALAETEDVFRARRAHNRRLNKEAQQEINEGLREEGIVPRG